MALRGESTLSCLNRLFPFSTALVHLYHMMKYILALLTVSAIYDQRGPEKCLECISPREEKMQQIGLIDMKETLAKEVEQDMTSKWSASPQGSAFGFSNRPSRLCLYLKAICIPYLYLKAVAEYHSLNGSIFTSHLASFVLRQHCPFI